MTTVVFDAQTSETYCRVLVDGEPFNLVVSADETAESAAARWARQVYDVGLTPRPRTDAEQLAMLLKAIGAATDFPALQAALLKDAASVQLGKD